MTGGRLPGRDEGGPQRVRVRPPESSPVSGSQRRGRGRTLSDGRGGRGCGARYTISHRRPSSGDGHHPGISLSWHPGDGRIVFSGSGTGPEAREISNSYLGESGNVDEA